MSKPLANLPSWFFLYLVFMFTILSILYTIINVQVKKILPWIITILTFHPETMGNLRINMKFVFIKIIIIDISLTAME